MKLHWFIAVTIPYTLDELQRPDARDIHNYSALALQHTHGVSFNKIHQREGTPHALNIEIKWHNYSVLPLTDKVVLSFAALHTSMKVRPESNTLQYTVVPTREPTLYCRKHLK